MARAGIDSLESSGKVNGSIDRPVVETGSAAESSVPLVADPEADIGALSVTAAGSSPSSETPSGNVAVDGAFLAGGSREGASPNGLARPPLTIQVEDEEAGSRGRSMVISKSSFCTVLPQ